MTDYEKAEMSKAEEALNIKSKDNYQSWITVQVEETIRKYFAFNIWLGCSPFFMSLVPHHSASGFRKSPIR